MMRVFRLVVWFVLGFCASAVPLLAYAETISAISNPRTGTLLWVGSNGNTSKAGSDPLAVCVAIWGAGATQASPSGGKYYCQVNGAFMNGWPLSNVVACTVGDANPGTYEGCSGNVYSCPPNQNWTLSGTTCTRPDCSAGELRDPATGSCIQDCNSAASKANTGKFFDGSGSPPSSLCVGGCSFSTPFCVGFGNEWGCQAGAGTGQNCSGAGVSQSSAAKKACMEKGEGVGTVNGITVCSGPASVTKTEGTKNTTTTNSGGTSSSTKTENTTCSGGKCTTTTTETTSGGGTTTGTVEQDSSSFCQQNPGHLACKAETEQKQFCDEHPETAGCKELGDPGTESDLAIDAKGVSSITAASLASNASCPADIQLPKGMKFEWTPICQWAEALRPIVLALAWLAAGIIVLGGSF